MEELTNAELVHLVTYLAKVVLVNQAELQAQGIALAGARIVAPDARADAYANIQPLLALLDEGKLPDFLRAFQRNFSSR